MTTIKRLKCLRCGYEWYPRTPDSPKYCANKKCRSPYWNKPKVKQSGSGSKRIVMPEMNYAFIDGTNLHLTMANIGWALDYQKFRVYLREKYRVIEAYYFIGKVPGNEKLYSNLETWGYQTVFKPTQYRKGEGYKGNCDAELVLRAMVTLNDYDKAVVVSSDGDFSCLVEHLINVEKLKRVLAPCKDGCSYFLRKAAGSRIDYMDNLKEKLEYKMALKGEEAPRKDETL